MMFRKMILLICLCFSIKVWAVPLKFEFDSHVYNFKSAEELEERLAYDSRLKAAVNLTYIRLNPVNSDYKQTEWEQEAATVLRGIWFVGFVQGANACNKTPIIDWIKEE